jgi:hypothetical protein
MSSVPFPAIDKDVRITLLAAKRLPAVTLFASCTTPVLLMASKPLPRAVVDELVGSMRNLPPLTTVPPL